MDGLEDACIDFCLRFAGGSICSSFGVRLSRSNSSYLSDFLVDVDARYEIFFDRFYGEFAGFALKDFYLELSDGLSG